MRRGLRAVALSLGGAAIGVWTTAAWPQAASAPQEPAPQFDPGYLSNSKNIDVGREVWEQQCRHCHGKSAYPGKAPKLNPGQYTPDFVYDRVTYGFGKMPPWKDVFSLEQRKAVTAYIKSDNFAP
jgi:mono/diheme cytochrome c family protein